MCEQEGLRHLNRWDYYAHTCHVLDRTFREYGLRDLVKFVGPNNSSGGLHLEEAVRDLDDIIDIYSGHDYNYNRQYHWENMARRMSQIVESTGKPFWMDEYGMQMDVLRDTPAYGGYIAQIVSASISAGHQTSMIWTLMDQLFTGGTPYGLPDDAEDDGSHNFNRDAFHNGVHRWGVVKTVKTYQATTLYSAASKQGDDFAVLTVTSTQWESPVIVEGLPAGTTLYRHVYNPYSRLPGFGTEAKPRAVKVDERGCIESKIPGSGFCIFSTREVL